MSRPARYAAIAVASLALALIAVFRGPVFTWTVATSAGLATGYAIGIGELRLERGHLAVIGLHIARHGEPVLDATRVDVTYDFAELLRGGTHRFGLHSIAVDRPHVTIVRHKDQSLNIELPKGGAATPQLGTPLFFTARVRDGSVEIRDPFNPSPQAHLLRLDAINVDADVDSAHRTHYRVAAGVLSAPTVGAARSNPLKVIGTIDQDHDYAMHRITAVDIPVAGFVDYFVNSPAAQFLAGDVRNVDIKLFSLDLSHDGPMHLGGSVHVDGIAARVIGIDGPVTQLHGDLFLSDHGILAPHIDARIGRTWLVTSGGFYDFERPQFRIGVRGAADLRVLSGFFTFMKGQPVAGPISFTTLIEGNVGKPLIFARVLLPKVSWGTLPFHDGHGLVAYYADEVTMAPLEAHFGPIDAIIRGGMALSDHIDSEFVAHVSGPGRAIPYLDRVAPDVALQGMAIVAGRDLPLRARGLLYSAGSATNLSAFIAVDEHGRGEFGPITFDRPDGSEFSGSFVLDRPNSNSGFWAWARHFRFNDPGRPATLPGVTLPDFPTFGGTLDGEFAGGGAPSDFTLAGRVNGSAMEFLGIPVTTAAMTFGGTFHELRFIGIDARGPWGHITGNGAVAMPGAFLLSGNFDGTLQGLRRFTGDIGASGAAAGPFAVAVDGPRIIVQTQGVRLRGARIHGVPLEAFDGTLGVGPGSTLTVYGARARVAGSDIVAARTTSGQIAVAGADVPANELGAAGFPLDRGLLSFIGTAGFNGGLPSFSGGMALRGGAYAGHRIDAASDIDFGGSALDMRGAMAALDGQIGLVDGRVSGLGGKMAFDVRTQVPAGDLGSLASGLHLHLPYLTGSFGANVQITGSSADPQIDGAVTIPVGSINGLNFNDAAGRIAGGLRAISLRDASIQVGSTKATITGSYTQSGISVGLRSDAADLADFNGFFDVGDMLAGRGRVALSYNSLGVPSTNGDVALAGVRYRNFPLGSMTAQWSSRNGAIDTHLAMGGATGALNVDGTVTLARSRGPLLQGSTYDLRAKIDGLDVGNWLPIVGFSYPVVTGRLDVDGTLRGSARNPAIDLTATLSNGTVGRVPLSQAALAAHITQQAVALQNFAVQIPHLNLTGDGTAGIAPGIPLALNLHGHTDDIGGLAALAMKLPFTATGIGDVDVRVTGTRTSPEIAGTFDATNASAAGLAIPHVNGSFGLRGHSLVVQDTDVVLAKGAMTLGGSVPFTLSPFGIGPANAQLSFDVDARAVDLANFAPLLPKGSTLTGTLDGKFGVTGTTSTPQLTGNLVLARGAFALPGQTPLKNITGLLSFDRQTATLERLHADAGTGAVDGSGRIIFPVGGSALDFRFVANANHAMMSIPGFFSGQFDGDVSLTRVDSRPLVGGAVTVSNATIPFSALFGAGAGLGGNLPIPADLSFNLAMTAGKNVRIHSGAIDIGGEGTVNLTGTIVDPRLGGRFEASPGGTLVYFNRVFRVVRGTVAFDPNAGLVPSMDAIATTHVPNSDPDPSRNPGGSADITIDVTGPVTALNIELSSNPPYPREQILGLLLGASSIGAVNFGGTGGGPTTVGGTIAGAPTVTIGGLPPGLVSQQSGTISVNQQAFAILDAQFTRSLLSPIQNSLGNALGLTTLDLTLDYGGNVGFIGRKQLGKGNVYAIYGQSINLPLRQTFGVQAQPNPSFSYQITGFTQYGAAPFGAYPLNVFSTNQTVTAGQSPGGTSGFNFSAQRRYP